MSSALQEDPRDSDKRSKLGGARPSATPRGAGKRNPRLPVHAAGGDALVGARLGVYSVLDDATHRVRQRLILAPSRHPVVIAIRSPHWSMTASSAAPPGIGCYGSRAVVWQPA